MVQADQMPVFQYLTAEARSACRDGILPITRLHVAKPCIETAPVDEVDRACGQYCRFGQFANGRDPGRALNVPGLEEAPQRAQMRLC